MKIKKYIVLGIVSTLLVSTNAINVNASYNRTNHNRTIIIPPTKQLNTTEIVDYKMSKVQNNDSLSMVHNSLSKKVQNIKFLTLIKNDLLAEKFHK